MSPLEPSEIVVLGLGNPMLRDDGVGVYVVRALKEKLSGMGIASKEGALTGLNFLDELTGYRKAIIVDAVRTGRGKPGSVYRLGLEDLEVTRQMSWSHSFGLVAVLEVARKSGLVVPDEVVLFGIEIEDTGFGEHCTPQVLRAVPRVAAMVAGELEPAAERSW